jgi:hypothetical protein
MELLDPERLATEQAVLTPRPLKRQAGHAMGREAFEVLSMWSEWQSISVPPSHDAALQEAQVSRSCVFFYFDVRQSRLSESIRALKFERKCPDMAKTTGTYDAKTGAEGAAAELYPLDQPSKRRYTRRIADFYAALRRDTECTGSGGDFKVQLYYVENESNGMLSYDRAVWKVDAAAIAAASSPVSVHAPSSRNPEPRQDLTLPPLFADGMVLQGGQAETNWGSAAQSAAITLNRPGNSAARSLTRRTGG